MCGVSQTVASEQRAALLADPARLPHSPGHQRPHQACGGANAHRESEKALARLARGGRARCAWLHHERQPPLHSGAQTNFARSAKYGSAAIVSSHQKLIQEVDSILMTKERDLLRKLWL